MPIIGRTLTEGELVFGKLQTVNISGSAKEEFSFNETDWVDTGSGDFRLTLTSSLNSGQNEVYMLVDTVDSVYEKVEVLIQEQNGSLVLHSNVPFSGKVIRIGS